MPDISQHVYVTEKLSYAKPDSFSPFANTRLYLSALLYISHHSSIIQDTIVIPSSIIAAL